MVSALSSGSPLLFLAEVLPARQHVSSQHHVDSHHWVQIFLLSQLVQNWLVMASYLVAHIFENVIKAKVTPSLFNLAKPSAAIFLNFFLLLPSFLIATSSISEFLQNDQESPVSWRNSHNAGLKL